MPCPAFRPCASYFPSKESRANILYHKYSHLHKILFPFDAIKTNMVKENAFLLIIAAFLFIFSTFFPIFPSLFMHKTHYRFCFRNVMPPRPARSFAFYVIDILRKALFAVKIVDSKLCLPIGGGAKYAIYKEGDLS